jgi:hypothetical protein
MRLGVSVVVDFGGVVGGEEATTKTAINSPHQLPNSTSSIPTAPPVRIDWFLQTPTFKITFNNNG